MWSNRSLSLREVLTFFTALSLIYIYPIMHADYAYIDDSWRSLLGAKDAWRNQGRVLIEWLYQLLTFGSSTTNIFPLPLLLSVLVLAMAMSRLTHWYFPAPSVSSCLVVIPVLCNPFFLGNLSYQYDGPAMVLAVVTVIYAITCRVERASLRHCAAALLIAVMFGLYQLTVALFIGLCVVELHRGVTAGKTVREVLSLLVQRVGQLFGGAAVYFLTAYQMAVDTRGDLYPFNEHWLSEVLRKFSFAMDKISLLVTPGNLLVCALVFVIGTVGFVRSFTFIRSMNGHLPGKVVVALLYLLSVPVLILIVPGFMLFLMEPNLDARNYIAFSAVLVFLFMLNDEVLGRVQPRLPLLLAIPVLCMFSFSYAYGQVIIAKKELEAALAQFVATDLISRAELATVKKIYLIVPQKGGNWLPRGHAAMTYMPLLRYILSTSNTLLHPQFLTRLGINNVVGGSREEFLSTVLPAARVPVVDRNFYSIYLGADEAFIVMKDVVASEDYNANEVN